jgi:hypothetical protein
MEVRNAFQNLLDSLRHELDGTKAAGSHAFELGEFENAQKAANQGQAIMSILEAVKGVADQWDSAQFAEAASPEPKPAPKGTPEPVVSSPILDGGDYVVPVLQALEDMGGKGKTDALEIDGGSKRWKKAVPSVRKEMTKKGYIYSNTPADEWKLTPQGRLYLFEQIDPTQNA